MAAQNLDTVQSDHGSALKCVVLRWSYKLESPRNPGVAVILAQLTGDRKILFIGVERLSKAVRATVEPPSFASPESRGDVQA